MWRNHANLWVRSAGTSPSAKRTVNKGGILWADVIFVMEEKHKCRLRAQFTQLLLYIDIQVLDIPDDYQFMDGALVEILKATVGAYLKLDTCY
ncbi:phosphotyrosine protein phosphatase [Pseudoalteromonas sp. Of7M-16]|nr:phosphotyrosine protein phosphatase [Pseudoalteromonas sp. Of7M-16]MCG7546608.1 phosphotyrosine protein phosphatase [Pseudoalteromonas sp. Of7M-16]